MVSVKEKLFMKWDDFQNNIITSIHDLQGNGDFSDVTLVCEEDLHIEAHRVILSACSPFFMNIFKKNKHSHPMIYMRGLKTRDLAAAIEFIYHGETNIFKDDFDTFLVLAEELQLNGLSGLIRESENFRKKIKPINNIKTMHTEDKFTNIANEVEFHKDMIVQTSTDTNSTELNTAIVTVNNVDELDEHIKSMMKKIEGDNHWACNICGKITRNKSKTSEHIEANHIDGVAHPCNQCEKVCRLIHILGSHSHFYNVQNLVVFFSGPGELSRCIIKESTSCK